jgi:peptidoglycan/xylan/chitin deacetylase (PgdA/CDA1 family)
MYFPRPYGIIRLVYPEAVFRLQTDKDEICLTFDDGPDPDSTYRILELLNIQGIKAVFFCSGMKAQKYPEIIKIINSEGHHTGNHGFHHYDGWKTATEIYVRDINKAAEIVPCRIFRPPFGRIRLSQYSLLKERYNIFFWDIMPYDYDVNLPWKNSYNMLCRNLRKGSVIALHDQQGSSCHKYLKMFITESHDKGYRFILPESNQ